MPQRTALVTGGNRGIGLEVCRQLKENGLRVVLTARNAAFGKKEASRLGVEFELLDAGAKNSIADCASRLRKSGTTVDVLVNNAGIYPRGAVLVGLVRDLPRRRVDANLRLAVRG